MIYEKDEFPVYDTYPVAATCCQACCYGFPCENENIKTWRRFENVLEEAAYTGTKEDVERAARLFLERHADWSDKAKDKYINHTIEKMKALVS